MAFWGVEVKPGKPYTHRHNPSHGRLRICQATLGSCDASTRTVVQCNVGNKKPVILCSLNPRLAEMCHLEIELQEDDEVLFSVLGQSAVHLSGYYLRSSSICNAGDEESESYGEDVGESDTDGEDVVSEDSYESDFIDDGDAAVSEDKCGFDSIDDGYVCSTPYHHKQEALETHAGKVERRQHLKKKNQVDKTDDNCDNSPYKSAARHNAPSIFDSGSEDEDNMPRSHSLPKKDNGKASVVIKTENVQPNEDKGKVSMEIKTENDQPNDDTRKRSKDARKRKSGAISQDPASLMDLTVVNGSSISKQEAEVKKKSKKKKRTPLEAENGEHSNHIRTLENGLIIEDLSTRNLGAKMASIGNKVYISYVGMLQDGKIVESNVGGRPYKFKLGSGEAFPGWDDGISGMHVGNKRRLTIPPSMCYGDKAAGKIPKNWSIIYEVELVKVR